LALKEWSHLLDEGSLSAEQSRTAKAHRAGLHAEKDMAYYLKARFGGDPELMIFNDLKFEHRDMTAQIDHLVLSRWSAYFIETKSVSQRININANGQWARVYGRKYVNIESPLEQSRRHEAILFDLLESRLPDFMGKLLGLQKTFRKVVDVHHFVAISVGATTQGRGEKAVKKHLRALDQIPQLIAENHQAVRSSLLGSVIAEMRNAKTRKRDPAFSKQELDACRGLLLDVNTSKTPLERVHKFIESLVEQTADTTAPQPSVVPPTRTDRAEASPVPQQPAPQCPKCDSAMVLKTARRGDRAGRQFYGCSRFPKCRSIINID